MRLLRVAALICATGATAAGPAPATAQTFPTKPLRIVTSGIGGSADYVSRVIAHGLSGRLGQQVIVDNRPNGPISGEIVAKAPADGYTLIVSANSLWLGHLLQDTEPYDVIRDFASVTLATTSPNVLLVSPSLPAKSIKDLIAVAKAKPGELNYGSGATGASSHLAAELFNSMAGVRIVRIPYKSNAAQITDLLGGRIQLFFSNSTAAAAQIKGGKLRGLAVTSLKPYSLLPELPTIAATIPGYESVAINAVMAPAKTPAALIRRLNQEIVAVVQSTEARERFAPAGVEGVGSTPEQFAVAMREEIVKWGKIIKESGGMRD